MNPSPASTVLILGARGRLGLAATRAFAEAGWQVYAQMRPGATGPAMAGVQWISALAEDTPALAARSQGAQVVVHAMITTTSIPNSSINMLMKLLMVH